MCSVSYCKDTSPSLVGTADYYQKSYGIFRKTLMNQTGWAFGPEIMYIESHKEGNYNKQSSKQCKKGLDAIPLRGRPSLSWWKEPRYRVGKKRI